MKKILLSAFAIVSSTIVYANTTMCFKENHTSMSTIEKVKLNGGECKSIFSVNDMKNKGWIIDDIKITTSSNGMNYIYIFKDKNLISNGNTFNTTETQKDIEARILASLEKKKEKEKIEKELKRKTTLEQEGEIFYIAKCQSCHGKNGELEARGYSRPLNTLTLDEMEKTIRDYSNGTYDRGLAMVMRPIANTTTYKDLEKVYNYLNKINKK